MDPLMEKEGATRARARAGCLPDDEARRGDGQAVSHLGRSFDPTYRRCGGD
jgi:hypothetical protein